MSKELYLVEWVEPTTKYDRYTSMVVCAKNLKDALQYHPNGLPIDHYPQHVKYPDWVLQNNMHELEVTHLGTAVNSVGIGVVTSSYLNGY